MGLRALAVAGRRHRASLRSLRRPINSPWVAAARRNASGVDSPTLRSWAARFTAAVPLDQSSFSNAGPWPSPHASRAAIANSSQVARWEIRSFGAHSPPPSPGRVKALRGNAAISERTASSPRSRMAIA